MHFPAIWKRLIPFGDHPVPLIRSRGRSLDVHPGTGDEFAFSLEPGGGVAQWPGCLGIRCEGSPQPLGRRRAELRRQAGNRITGDEGCPSPACASQRMAARWFTFAAARPMRAGAWRIRPTESGHESSRCGRSRWTPALPGCWARWAARRKSAKMSQLSPDGQFAVWAAQQAIVDCSGERKPRQLISSPICAATMPVRGGRRMDGRSLSSASAVITASSPSMIWGMRACVISLRVRIAMACRAGRRTEATLLSSGVPAFRGNCR